MPGQEGYPQSSPDIGDVSLQTLQEWKARGFIRAKKPDGTPTPSVETYDAAAEAAVIPDTDSDL